MARNGSGTYSLPQPAFVSGTKISSAAVNSNFSDIASALTQSFSADGQTPFTGIFKNASGTVSAPSYTFSSDLTTGFWLNAAGQIGLAVAGTQSALFNSDRSVTWAGNASWVNGTFSGTLGVTGAATLSGTLASGNHTITGTLSVSSTSSFTGKASFTSTDSMAVANGTTAQRNGSPSAGDLRFNSTLNTLEYWNGSVWVQPGAAPTVQRFTSGSAQTYTPTVGMVRIRVRMCGGGGGGAATSTNNGSNGNDTSFGTWTAKAGAGGTTNGGAGGAGGTGGTNGTGTLVDRVPGGAGQGGGGDTGGGANPAGGQGGSNPRGGGGSGGNSAAAGGNGATNTGAGGGGGSGFGSNAGAGGGAGEYVEFWMTAAQVGANQTYTVGGTANGGTAGTNAGGNGAAGIIIVEEYYV